MKLTHVLCDFDGTVTVKDTSQAILDHFADKTLWRMIEDEWTAGRITSMECYRRQFALVNATKQTLLEFVVESIAVDPSFTAFVSFCLTNAVPLTILSDGFDIFIEALLRKANISDVPFVSNKLYFAQGRMDFGFLQSDMYKEHKDWKQAFVNECKRMGYEVIFVGNGLSDKGAAMSADLLFAKRGEELASWCDKASIPYVAFADFRDVLENIQNRLLISS